MHPWRYLRERPTIDVRFADLGDDGPLGVTDGQVITLTTGMLQVERRCVLMHELVHVERGIPHGHDPREESAVEREVARHLIGVDALADALAWSRDVYEVADLLWVMPHLVRVRVEGLHPSERHELQRRIHDAA